MARINLNKYKPKRVYTTSKHYAQKIYNTVRWKKLRAAYWMVHPICEICEADKVTSPTVHIHHKKPFSWGIDFEECKELAYDWDNLQAVCFKCHQLSHKQLLFNIKILNTK